MKFLALTALLLAPALAWSAENTSTTTTAPTETAQEQSNWSSFYQYQHRNLLNSEARKDGDMLPKSLQLRTHLLSIDYNLGNQWKAEAGVQYLDMDIRLLGNQMDINAGSRGLSDTEFGVKREDQFNSVNVKTKYSLSVPTGSIEKRDSVKVDMGPRRGGVQEFSRILPYQGQLGSGTYDMLAEADAKWTLGTPTVYWRNKVKLKHRNGKNKLGYRLGNEAKLISEMNFPIYQKYLTGMIGGTYKSWGKVHGANPVLVEMQKSIPYPVKFEDLYAKAGERLETYLAVKTAAPVSSFGLFTIEVGRPLSSYVSGNKTELKTDWYAYANFISFL